MNKEELRQKIKEIVWDCFELPASLIDVDGETGETLKLSDDERFDKLEALRNRVAAHMLNLIDQALEQGARMERERLTEEIAHAVERGARLERERILNLPRNFWEDEDHAVGGYISKKDLKEALTKTEGKE